MEDKNFKKEEKRLRMFICTFVASFIPVLINAFLYSSELLSLIGILGVMGSSGGIIYTLFRAQEADAIDTEERIKEIDKLLLSNYNGIIRAYPFCLKPYEKNEHPFFKDYTVRGRLELSGEINKKAFICRELDIYEIYQSKNQKTNYRKKFLGTTISWNDEYFDSNEFFICTPFFQKFSPYFFQYLGFEKLEKYNGTENILFHKNSSDNELYIKSCHLLELACKILKQPLQGLELCLWYKNGKYELYIYQLQQKNNVNALISSLNNFFNKL